MAEVDITTADAPTTPVVVAPPVKAEVSKVSAAGVTVSVRSNLEPRDPAEEYATAARNEAVLALAARYEEDGNTAAAVALRAKYDL